MILNEQWFHPDKLFHVRVKEDDDFDEDLQLKVFFQHSDEGWKIKKYIIACAHDNYNGRCGHSVRTYIMSMVHLFHDLNHEDNTGLSNRQKRFIEYQ